MRGYMDKEDAVSIRDFRKSDLDDLLDLLPRCFAKEMEFTGFDPAHMRGMVNRAFGTTGRLFLASSRLFGKEPVKFLVAEAKNRVVGTTMVNCGGKVGNISAVMVHPDYRRRGLATRLVRSAIEYTQKRRTDRAVLNAVSTNAPAISVYSKLGFKEFGRFAWLDGETGSLLTRGGAEVETRPFRQDDLDAVCNLTVASEDPNYLRIYDFSKKNMKKNLKTPFWLRLFRFSTQKRIVAARNGKTVGYVVSEYTTSKEAGNIRSIRVNPEDVSGSIERALIGAAVDVMRKGGIGRIRLTAPSTKQGLIETAKGLGFKEVMTMVEMSREARG